VKQPSAARVAATARRVERASGQLATLTQQRMLETLPWFVAMEPEPRSQVGLIVQLGLRGLATWLSAPGAGPKITAEVFATAPSQLARVVSLEQTVELVRIAVDVAEDSVPDLAAPAEQPWLRETVLRYSREIAFAAALVYAQAAEQRGAWDARLEALVVDAVVRGDVDDALVSRAAALGWSHPAQVLVVIGGAPDGDPERILGHVRHLGRDIGVDVLASIQTTRLVVIVGGGARMTRVTRALLPAFADGPVVMGPVVTGLANVAIAVQEAFAALRAAVAWPEAPRPVASDDLLPERALAGDPRAIAFLVEQVYTPLSADSALLATADAYVRCGGTIEATARELYVHGNTVRYRLRRIADLTGLDVGLGRDRFVVQVGIALGRLDAAGPAL
jgi:DNA-binding PucR family transcriptional regulator